MTAVFDPNYAYITSPFVSPLVLAIVRLLFAFYSLFTLIYTLAYQGSNGFFSYFTHLTYIGMTSYFWAAGVQGIVWEYTKRQGAGRYLLRSWPRPFQLAHEWLWSTIMSYPIVVTVVYWTLLASSFSSLDGVDTWSSISMHAINSLFCLSEVLLTHNPAPRWIWLIVDIIVLAMYLGLAYLSKYTLGFYVYSFLDPKKEGAFLAAYIAGIGIGEAIVFAIMYGIVRLRMRLIPAPHSADVEKGDVMDLDQASMSTNREKATVGSASP
ncbi:hypothetical protein CPB85DRAFT_1246121 [Mucidula mucida]|nr:hypothetical protein CPB85DRAFT_1246121 [Mucidula mucida]